MPEKIPLTINGESFAVEQDIMVSAAIANMGVDVFRKSVSGKSRGPVCGMGICFECRVTIDGIEHCRSCQTPVREGMKIESVR